MNVATEAPPLEGSTIDHFTIGSKLGEGGMGVVYRAWDTSLERPVALKTLLVTSEHTRALFLREARAQAKLRHPNVVPIHFVGDRPTITYLVMELVEGESLASLLARVKRLGENEALDIADAIAKALEAAHGHGLIHRDVKPGNVLVETGGRVLLSDFGLAKAIQATDDPSGAIDRAASPVMSERGAMIGTPAYAAPEQSAGGSVDHRADIYAVGVTLFEMLTGERPFAGETVSRIVTAHGNLTPLTPSTIVRDLRPEIDALVMRMLAKSPADRFQSYAELRKAIAAARAPALVTAPLAVRGIAFGVDFLVYLSVLAVLELVLKLPTMLTIVIVALFGILDGVWGQSPGKRLMSLKTTDPRGRPLTWRRGLARTFVKWSGVVLVLAIGAVFDVTVHATDGTTVTVAAGSDASAKAAPPPRKKPGLPTSLALAIELAWVGSLAMALGKRRMALHDRVANSRVASAVGEAVRAEGS